MNTRMETRNPRRFLYWAIIIALPLLALEGVSALALKMFPELSGLGTPVLTAARDEGVMVSDHVLNHKWKPNLVFEDKRIISTPRYWVNQDSWLARQNFSKGKPADTYRLFFLGDSNVQGLVPYQDRMVEILQTRLNRLASGNAKSLQLINTGTSSYSTIIYYLLIKTKLLDYDPDMVVICIDMTDVPNDQFYRSRLILDSNGNPAALLPFTLAQKQRYLMGPRGTIELSPVSETAGYLYRHSAFFKLAYGAYQSQKALGIDLQGDWLPWHYKTDRSADWLSMDWNARIRANVDYSMHILDKAIQLLKENDIKVVVTGVPHYPQFSGEWSDRPHGVLEARSKKSGAYFINTYAELKKTNNGELGTLYFEADPTHFNIKGNHVWADILFSHLAAELGLIKTGK